MARNPCLGAMSLTRPRAKYSSRDQADTKGYPASVLKLMDLLIILEKIEQKPALVAGPGARERQGLPHRRLAGMAGRQGVLHPRRDALCPDGPIRQ